MTPQVAACLKYESYDTLLLWYDSIIEHTFFAKGMMGINRRIDTKLVVASPIIYVWITSGK